MRAVEHRFSLRQRALRIHPSGEKTSATELLEGAAGALLWQVGVQVQKPPEPGILRRHQAAVGLTRVGSFEVEQSLLGRVLGYGTLVAGDLEVSYVSRPREVCRLVERL